LYHPFSPKMYHSLAAKMHHLARAARRAVMNLTDSCWLGEHLLF